MYEEVVMDVRVGTRVHVFNADQSEDWGLGTITTVESLVVEETGQVICPDYPSRIELDDGRVTEGMECWWSPIAVVGN